MLNATQLKKHRLNTILRLLNKAYFLNKRGKRDEMYNLIGDELLKLGGVYVKFLQGIILQSWFMQRWKGQQKLDIFENINSPRMDIEQVLKANLGYRRNELQNVEPQPFAIGSFGHVYKAQLKNGQAVIVKVLSAEISKTLKFDLKLLKFFWRSYLRSLKFDKNMNLKLIFDNFKKQTLKEIDYIGEAQFAREQYEIYKDHPKLVIPQTYLGLCTPQLIVQDYVRGVSVTNLLKLLEKNPKIDLKKHVKQKLKTDLVEVLQILGYEILWGTFNQSRIMGDPHPGNVIIMENNQIALIDFGISSDGAKDLVAFLKLIEAYYTLTTGKFNPQDIFVANFQFFARDLYLALSKVSGLSTVGQKNIDLNRELAKIAQTNFEAAYPNEDVKQLMQTPRALAVFDRFANRNNRFSFQFEFKDTGVVRTMVTLTSMLDLLKIYKEVMQTVYKKTLDQVYTVYPELQSLNYKEMSYSQAFGIVFAWLERVATRDPELFYNILSKLKLNRNNFEPPSASNLVNKML